MVVGQVDHSIDQDEDLLAVDSIDNEVDTAVAVYLRHVIIGFYFMSHSSVPSSPLPPYLPRKVPGYQQLHAQQVSQAKLVIVQPEPVLYFTRERCSNCPE